MDQIREIEAARLIRLEQHPELASHAMVGLRARVIGVGIATADRLVHEIRSRNLRDRKAWLAEPVLGPATGRTRGPA